MQVGIEKVIAALLLNDKCVEIKLMAVWILKKSDIKLSLNLIII